MKKLTNTIIAVMMILSITLVGCKGSTSGSDSSKKDKAVKVGFLYVGPVGDGGFTFSHDQGRLYLEKETGVKTIIKESVKEDKAEVIKVCEDMINQGCNVIIGTSFGFMDGMEESAKKHADIKYLHCSGYKTSKNMSTYFGREYQARYLSGIVAGMKTKTNKIGYVGAYEIPEVVRGINAFTLGVQSVNKTAVVNVKWTHTWYDPAKEKEAAKALIAEGADIITQHQDTAGPQQAAEEAGIFSIGYNSSMKDKAPKAYMTAPIWNWGPYYVKQIKEVKAGTWKSESYWGPMNDGIIQLDELTANAPEGAKDAVEKAKADILNGKNKIFQGPINDQQGNVKIKQGQTMTDEEMLKFDWFVQGVQGKVK